MMQNQQKKFTRKGAPVDSSPLSICFNIPRLQNRHRRNVRALCYTWKSKRTLCQWQLTQRPRYLISTEQLCLSLSCRQKLFTESKIGTILDAVWYQVSSFYNICISVSALFLSFKTPWSTWMEKKVALNFFLENPRHEWFYALIYDLEMHGIHHKQRCDLASRIIPISPIKNASLWHRTTRNLISTEQRGKMSMRVMRKKGHPMTTHTHAKHSTVEWHLETVPL